MTSNSPPIIVTDGTCDLPHALYEQYGIKRVPLRVLFGDESYLSGVDMNLDQFAERLARGDVHPTTSQPAVGDFQTLYETLGADGRPILSIHISQGLSGTFNVASQAAKALPNQQITVYDSRTISAALGLQVLTAARAAVAGHTTEQIIPLLDATHTNANLLFVMDDLSYLLRGGRIGSVRYHVAQALSIKPIISVSKIGTTAGTYVSVGRVRQLSRAVGFFVDQITKDVGEGNKLRAMIFYGTGPTPELAAQLYEQLTARFECVFVEKDTSTPVLGVHVGPHAFDVGYIADDWPA